MLTPKIPQLIPAQGIHWSTQRVVAVVTQISILIIAMILLSNVVITLGERRLQEDWAAQRYSELQAVGSLIADKVSFQQFRTQMFAKSELLNRYLNIPSEVRQLKLEQNWDVITSNIPELLDIALFDPQGKFKFSTTENFSHEPLPPALLGGSRNMGGNEIYTSALEFTPINGKLEPYMYQLAWLENPDQSIRGYLVTYNSMSRMLKSIKPAYSSTESPLLMLDTQGLLYAGAEKKPTIKRIPDTMGGSLKQTYPALWRKMAMSNFGQFHGDDATFVYLKVELATQYEARREYFLVSYVRNDDIAANFSEWRNILITVGIALTTLASLLILLSHFYRLEQRSRQYSAQLASRLFGLDGGCLIVNDTHRVISANEQAAHILSSPIDELKERSLQRILQLEDEQFEQVLSHLKEHSYWSSELADPDANAPKLRVVIKSETDNHFNPYLLVSFEDITVLKQTQHKAHLNELLNDNAVATALIQADGSLEMANGAFQSLMSVTPEQQVNLIKLLNNDLGEQWSSICQQIMLQGQWQGKLLCEAPQLDNHCVQATLKGHLDNAGDIEYIVCTLERAIDKEPQAEQGNLKPHRSTILTNLRDLDNYFTSLSPFNRDSSSLVLMDITAEGMLSHMSDIGQLESRQKEVELHLLKGLPMPYQMSHWQLGKLIIILPNTSADNAHQFAVKSLNDLNDIGLGSGICMGIAAYQQGQSLELFLSNAEVALKRAKQIGEQNICQAFTRQS
ncbi:diguanylate cyclase [Shewanella sp. Scap07]|uniref:diguanylate cyclase n=1 Tax=Shewanella sp. Scap07 TaxID=2589987 RepID=UPI0015B790E9|nr:diguanylate cyclase [Shewanella sp. Scap07]QLE84349.1 diguanylate cyclase [Shewanella sp. Scap07]